MKLAFRVAIVLAALVLAVLVGFAAVAMGAGKSPPTPGPRAGVGMRVSPFLDHDQCAALLGHQCTNDVHMGWAVQTAEAQKQWTPTPIPSTPTPPPTQTPHIIQDVIFLPATMTPGPSPTARIVERLQVRVVVATATPPPVVSEPAGNEDGVGGFLPIVIGGGALYLLARGNRKQKERA